MFCIVAFQTERCLLASADIGFLRITDVLFAGTMAGFTLHSLKRRGFVADLETGGVTESGDMAGDTARVEVPLLFQKRFKGKSMPRRRPLEVFLLMATPTGSRRHIPVFRLLFQPLLGEKGLMFRRLRDLLVKVSEPLAHGFVLSDIACECEVCCMMARQFTFCIHPECQKP